MVVVPRATAVDGRLLNAAIRDFGVTLMQGTPMTWRLLLASGWEGNTEMRALVGGEAMPEDLARALLPRTQALWNMWYGPPPNHGMVLRTHKRTSCGHQHRRPIANTDAYVSRMPSGVCCRQEFPGNYGWAVPGVAAGYWQRNDLTAARFIDNNFTARACISADISSESQAPTTLSPQEKLYRTETGSAGLTMGDCSFDASTPR